MQLARELPEKVEQVGRLACHVKHGCYGKFIVMFAPTLHLSSHCINSYVYCQYHSQNKNIACKKISQEKVARGGIALQDMGHKLLALEVGEHPTMNPIEYILECINIICSIKHKNGAIRRANVNLAAATEPENGPEPL